MLYECALCGGCTKECATGWDPVMFTKEARLACGAGRRNCPNTYEKLITNLTEKPEVFTVSRPWIRSSKPRSRLFPRRLRYIALLRAATHVANGSVLNAIEAVELLQKAGVNFAVT